jgi:hypothetical protein
MRKHIELNDVILKTSSPSTGEDKGEGEKNLFYPLTLTLSRQGRGKFRRISGNENLVVGISRALAQPQ